MTVEALGKDATPIRVTWGIDAGLTGAQAKDAARTDAVAILTAVKSTAEYGYTKVVLIGMYPVGGASSPARRVVEATYDKPTLDRLNLSALDPRKVFEVGNGTPFLDPSMRSSRCGTKSDRRRDYSARAPDTIRSDQRPVAGKRASSCIFPRTRQQ